MGKITLGYLKPDSPVFKRGPVAFNPAAIRDGLKAKIASEDETPTSTRIRGSGKLPSFMRERDEKGVRRSDG